MANLKPFLQSKNVYVKKTRSRGWGLFAKRAFRKDETLFIVKGRIIQSKKYDSRYRIGPRWISMGAQTWISPFPKNGLWFLNHSCHPNVGRKGLLTIVAMKKIKQGDEITLDYSTTEEDPYWKMKCRCSEKGCRKTLRSIQSLSLRLFKKYKKYIPLHLQRAFGARLTPTQR